MNDYEVSPEETGRKRKLSVENLRVYTVSEASQNRPKSCTLQCGRVRARACASACEFLFPFFRHLSIPALFQLAFLGERIDRSEKVGWPQKI